MKEEAVVNERKPHSGSAFQAIRAIDYTVIFVRDMAAMRRFYEDILAFPLSRELSPGWIEYRVGDNTLTLARPSLTASDVPTPSNSASRKIISTIAGISGGLIWRSAPGAPSGRITAPTGTRGIISRTTRPDRARFAGAKTESGAFAISSSGFGLFPPVA